MNASNVYDIYLSGHVDYVEDAEEWRNAIKRQWYNDPDIDFIDPVEKFPKYDGNEQEVVWWCINQAVVCDGMLVKWDNETLTVGTIMEITIAFMFHNPIIIWYEGPTNELSPFLEVFSTAIYNESDNCIRQLKKEMRQFTRTPW